MAGERPPWEAVESPLARCQRHRSNALVATLRAEIAQLQEDNRQLRTINAALVTTCANLFSTGQDNGKGDKGKGNKIKGNDKSRGMGRGEAEA